METPVLNTLVYEDEHIVCIFQPGQKVEALIFSFSEMLMRPHPDNRIWAGGPIKKLGYPAFGFVAKTQNWFPKTSMMKAIDAIKDIQMPAGKRIGYGFSMGGWAAFFYAKQLGLDSVISFSPQFSINPSEVLDRRFTKHFDPTLNQGMSIKDDCRGADNNIVVCDPKDLGDWESAQKIAAKIGAELVKLPFAGHGTVRCVTSTSVLSGIFSAMIKGDISVAVERIKASRKAAPARPMQLAFAMTVRHPEAALSIYVKHKECFPNVNRAAFFFKLRNSKFNRRCLRELFEIYPSMKNQAQYLAVLALFLSDIGRKDVATDCIERALKIQDSQSIQHIREKILTSNIEQKLKRNRDLI